MLLYSKEEIGIYLKLTLLIISILEIVKIILKLKIIKYIENWCAEKNNSKN